MESTKKYQIGARSGVSASLSEAPSCRQTKRYKYTGCANRSCGPPKPGRRLLNGVRWCRRGSAGGPLGPHGVPEGPWGRRGVPRGSVHQSCIDTGQSKDPSSHVGSRRAKNRVPTETRRNPIWPDRTRGAPTDHSTVPYQCTTDMRTYTGPYRTLTYPDRT